MKEACRHAREPRGLGYDCGLFLEREVVLGAGTHSECQEEEIYFSYSLKLGY